MNRLSQHKRQAKLLLKQLNDADASKSEAVAKRLLQLPFLKYSNEQKVLIDKPFFQLKHCHAVIAIENGFDNWTSFREQIIRGDCFYTKQCSVFLNVWFANYNDAKQYHNQEGGYLLKYRSDYYVADENVIKALKLDSFTKEWSAIGNDIESTSDKSAFSAIYKQAKANYLK